MAGKITCTYCAHWQDSQVHKVIANNDENGKKKKKKKKKREKIKQIRTCKLTSRRVRGTTEACRYFKPRLYFYCYTSKYWLSIYQCLSRRRNRKSYLKNKDNPTKKNKKIYLYPSCTSRCSQFKDDILPICKKLKINRLGQPQKPRLRKIKRRPKKEHRTIKRRVKKKVVRVIIRRSKKKRRIIKRR